MHPTSTQLVFHSPPPKRLGAWPWAALRPSTAFPTPLVPGLPAPTTSSHEPKPAPSGSLKLAVLAPLTTLTHRLQGWASGRLLCSLRPTVFIRLLPKSVAEFPSSSANASSLSHVTRFAFTSQSLAGFQKPNPATLNLPTLLRVCTIRASFPRGPFTSLVTTSLNRHAFGLFPEHPKLRLEVKSSEAIPCLPVQLR